MLVSQVGLSEGGLKILTLIVTSQTWTPLNESQRAMAEYSVNNVQTEALRQLVPNSGAYVNEVCPSGPSLSVEQLLTKLGLFE